MRRRRRWRHWPGFLRLGCKSGSTPPRRRTGSTCSLLPPSSQTAAPPSTCRWTAGTRTKTRSSSRRTTTSAHSMRWPRTTPSTSSAMENAERGGRRGRVLAVGQCSDSGGHDFSSPLLSRAAAAATFSCRRQRGRRCDADAVAVPLRMPLRMPLRCRCVVNV